MKLTNSINKKKTLSFEDTLLKQIFYSKKSIRIMYEIS